MKDELKLLVVLGSTREGRSGAKVAEWFNEIASRSKYFQLEFIDLMDWNIPFISGSNRPGPNGYADPLVEKWSKKVAGADAYVLITPEYNHGYPAVLKNALDVIYSEWAKKPIAFVSYGGASGGSRAVEQLRQVAIEFHMAPIRDQVLIPHIWQAFDEAGKPLNAHLESSANKLLEELHWWANALQTARKTIAVPEKSR